MKNASCSIDGFDTDDIVAKCAVAELARTADVVRDHLPDRDGVVGNIDGKLLVFLMQNFLQFSQRHSSADGDGHVTGRIVDDGGRDRLRGQ